MPDDLGLSNVVVSPILERVVREERLREDQPRKPRDTKAKPHKGDADESIESDETQKADNSVSSQHIDLRI